MPKEAIGMRIENPWVEVIERLREKTIRNFRRLLPKQQQELSQQFSTLLLIVKMMKTS